MEDPKLVVGYLTDDTSLVKSVPLSTSYDWLKWLSVEQLAEFFEELFEVLRRISEGDADSETLQTFLDDWCEIALDMEDPVSLLKAFADSIRASTPNTDRTIFTAFEESGAELTSPLINIVGVERDYRSPLHAGDAEPADRVVTEEQRDFLDQSLSNFGLSGRAQTCLKRENIRTIRELVAKEEWDLLEYKGLGEGTLNEIRNRLAFKGFSLGMDLDDIEDEEDF